MIKQYFPEFRSPNEGERRVGYGLIAAFLTLSVVLSFIGLLTANSAALLACGMASGVIMNMHGLSPTKGLRHVIAMLILCVPIYITSHLLIFVFLGD